MMTRASKILESLNKLKIKSYINEEFPNELKLLNSTQLKKVGDLLSKNNFDVQRTDFGQLESNVSNRDPRLKDSNYIMFVLREYPEPTSSGRKLSPDLFVLQDGELLYGDEHFFKNSSWTKFVSDAKIWFISKISKVSTKEIRQERSETKNGALALEVQKARTDYEKRINDYKKKIEQYKLDIKNSPDNTGYFSKDEIQKRLDREQGWLNDFLKDHDKSTGMALSGIEKYRKQLRELQLKAKDNEFDELQKDGKLLNDIQSWLENKSKQQVQFFKNNFKASNKDDNYGFGVGNYKSSNVISDTSDDMRNMMRFMERWIRDGYLDQRDKKDLLELLKK